MIESGLLLGDRYRLVQQIAVGGMGEVWQADDELLGRQVAVKVLRGEHAVDPAFVARFRAEARHAAALSHPGIVVVHDYGETVDDGRTLAYLVMELVSGEPLSTLLTRTGPLPVERTLDIVAATADALQAAHDSGVIHRDVKPGNILLRPDGSVTITDFGIARATTDPGHLTRTGLVLGTAYYLPPEQASGDEITTSSDLYALGVVGYECLTGAPPFSGENPVQVAVAHLRDEPPPLPEVIPLPVRQLVTRLLAKDPRERPARAADVAIAARALREDPTDATGAAATRLLPRLADAPTTSLEAPADAAVTAGARPRWQSDAYPGQRRMRSLLLLVGLAVVVVGALLLVLVGGGHQDKKVAATSSPTPTPTASTPTTVTLLARDYLGEPFPSVQRQLSALGFTVRRQDMVADAEVGTVIAITPTGRVPVGSPVTVTVAQAPPKREKHGHGEGQGNND